MNLCLLSSKQENSLPNINNNKKPIEVTQVVFLFYS